MRNYKVINDMKRAIDRKAEHLATEYNVSYELAEEAIAKGITDALEDEQSNLSIYIVEDYLDWEIYQEEQQAEAKIEEYLINKGGVNDLERDDYTLKYMKFKDKIGGELRKRREKMNLTGAELGEKSGTTGYTILAIERGNRTPSLKNLYYIITDGLEITVDTFFRGLE